eukprot:m.693728 g.693728  ORF g.693728 m.693728 type:complete len:312 (+) comp22875_c0_seq5:154-1089(+)
MAGTKQLWSLVGFGEAMIRFAPVSDPGENGQTFLRSVGGDELNVCVDLAKLDTPDATHPAPQWVSVLPTGPLGDLVAESGERVGVSLAHTKRIPHSDIGIFTVLPELKTVHYQRRNSAFAKHVPASFDWQSILAPKPDGTRHWLHVTGITPLIAESPRLSWTLALQAACELGVPVSMDFNHRKQLGTLSELWAVVLPHLSQLEVLILSVGSMVELAGLCGIPVRVSETFVLRSECPMIMFFGDCRTSVKYTQLVLLRSIVCATVSMHMWHQQPRMSGTNHIYGGKEWQELAGAPASHSCFFKEDLPRICNI